MPSSTPLPRIAITTATTLAIALGIGACTNIDYDTSQPRDWIEVYTLDSAPFPTYIDRSSIKPSEEGVQFDEMGKARDERGVYSSVATFTLNCKSGVYTELQRTWLNAEGKPTQQEKKIKLNDPTTIPEVLVNYRSLCREVGAEPKF